LPAIIPIDNPLDPRLEVFRQVRERDVAGRHGGFIAEGEVVLRVLARSRLCHARCLLIAERRLERSAPLIAEFGQEVAVYSAAQAVMDAVVGFPIHRGMLAFGVRLAPPRAEDLLASLQGPAIVLALFGISNHDNVGGVFRNAAAFGAGAVLLDGACCDPLYRKAIRVSTGAALMTPFARLDAGADAVELLQRGGFVPFALSPRGGTPLRDLRPPPRAAVLLGSEGHGLPAPILAQTRTVSIPMATGVDSLNVATASGIVLHHLAERRPWP
jgi:tRNA G18 (ribose-2'-O)-methylase SpoU